MWQTSLLVRYLWVASPIVQLILAAILVRFRLYRDFPLFFTYTIVRPILSLVCFFLFVGHYLDGVLFGYANWAQEIVCIILRFGVIYELVVVLLKPYPSVKNVADWFFRIGNAVLLLTGVFLAASYRWAAFDTRIGAGINLVDRTVDVMQCGVLLLLLVFTKYLRLSWRNYSLGIAIGLGIYAAVDLATSSLLMETGKIAPSQQVLLGLRMTILSMAAYLFSVLIWLAYALVPESNITDPGSTLPEHDLDAWNQELQRLLQR